MCDPEVIVNLRYIYIRSYTVYVRLAIYIRCIYGIIGRESNKYTVSLIRCILRLWPYMYVVKHNTRCLQTHHAHTHTHTHAHTHHTYTQVHTYTQHTYMNSHTRAGQASASYAELLYQHCQDQTLLLNFMPTSSRASCISMNTACTSTFVLQT